MTKNGITDRLARGLGVVLGVSLAAVALIAWRVPGGEGTLGADVRVETLQTGEVGVAPLHPFLTAPSLMPGSQASGSVTLRNQTGSPLAVRLRARPSSRDLDRILRVQVRAGGRPLYDGGLGGLRASGTLPLRLAPAASVRVGVRAWLPGGLRTGFKGRIVAVTLDVDSRRAP
jgi:hypothetical protein